MDFFSFKESKTTSTKTYDIGKMFREFEKKTLKSRFDEKKAFREKMSDNVKRTKRLPAAV